MVTSSQLGGQQVRAHPASNKCLVVAQGLRVTVAADISGLVDLGETKILLDDLSGPEIAGFLEEHIEEMKAVTPPGSKHALDLD